MSEPVANLKAVIVGATGGIGLAVCKLLADSGGEAFLIGRSERKLHELSQQYGWGYAVADGSDWAQLDGVVSSAEGLLGGINAAINLAGSVLLNRCILRVERSGTRPSERISPRRLDF